MGNEIGVVRGFVLGTVCYVCGVIDFDKIITYRLVGNLLFLQLSVFSPFGGIMFSDFSL